MKSGLRNVIALAVCSALFMLVAVTLDGALRVVLLIAIAGLFLVSGQLGARKRRHERAKRRRADGGDGDGGLILGGNVSDGGDCGDGGGD